MLDRNHRNFERDLQNKIKKAKRDVEVVVLYNELGKNISEVSRRTGMHRDTVSRIIKQRLKGANEMNKAKQMKNDNLEGFYTLELFRTIFGYYRDEISYPAKPDYYNCDEETFIGKLIERFEEELAYDKYEFTKFAHAIDTLAPTMHLVMCGIYEAKREQFPDEATHNLNLLEQHRKSMEAMAARVSEHFSQKYDR